MLRIAPCAARAIESIRLVCLQQRACAGNRRAGFHQPFANAFKRAPATCGGGSLADEIYLAHCRDFPEIFLAAQGYLPFGNGQSYIKKALSESSMDDICQSLSYRFRRNGKGFPDVVRIEVQCLPLHHHGALRSSIMVLRKGGP